MRALRVHEALALERLVDLVPSNKCICMVLTTELALRISTHMLALLEGSLDVCWDAVVVRRAINLYFITLLFSWDDHIARITPNVDHVAKIAVGLVVVVSLLFLTMIGDMLVPKRSLLIAHVTALVKVLRHRLVFQPRFFFTDRWDKTAAHR